MKLTYRFIAAVLLIISVIILPACSGKKDKEKNETPEDFLIEVYDDLANGNKTLEDVYINDFSLNSSKSITLDEFKQLFDGIKIKGIENVSSLLIEYPGDPVYEISFTLKYEKNGQEYIQACKDYVIYTFNEYKCLLNGYLNRKYYKMAETSDTNAIHCDSLSIFNTVNGKIIQIVINNDTPNDYLLGNDESGIRMIAKTDAGLLMETAENCIVLESGTKKSVNIHFKDVFNKLNKISITRIYKLDDDGQKLNSGDGIEYSFTISE